MGVVRLDWIRRTQLGKTIGVFKAALTRNGHGDGDGDGDGCCLDEHHCGEQRKGRIGDATGSRQDTR